jgi:exopolysaccharide biosynthesis polyprenyl glycosylphosphotransferase
MRLTPKICRYALVKRVFDILIASIALILLLPLFLLIAVLVRLSSPGPIIYRSERIGLCGAPFQFPKFRSMYTDSDTKLQQLMTENEKDGPIFKIKKDPRITPVGRFLRKYSLDELPQFISVIRGEMSLVGPRPPIRREVEQYDEVAMRRLTVKPGITCYWQVMGRSDLTFDEWMELDNQYINEMSFLVDLSIVMKTPMAVIRGRGAY